MGRDIKMQFCTTAFAYSAKQRGMYTYTFTLFFFYDRLSDSMQNPDFRHNSREQILISCSPKMSNGSLHEFLTEQIKHSRLTVDSVGGSLQSLRLSTSFDTHLFWIYRQSLHVPLWTSYANVYRSRSTIYMS